MGAHQPVCSRLSNMTPTIFRPCARAPAHNAAAHNAAARLRRPVVRSALRDAGSEDGESHREQAAKLDALFFKRDEPTGNDEVLKATSSLQGEGRNASSTAATFEDLPLWRVQWATLPGTQEVLHVHVPHYTHMFESIMAGPRPWRFGHVYLPGGSASLGTLAAVIHSTSASAQSADSGAAANDTDDLEACGAPSVGSLMELVSALRCRDGRLLILAYSVGRIQWGRVSSYTQHCRNSMLAWLSDSDQVETVTQEVPYSKGRCRLLPDAEEMAAAESLASHVVEDAPLDATLVSAMAATISASKAAAAASAEVWQQWEVAALLQAGNGVSMLSEDSEGLAALRRIEERPIVVPLSATVAAGGGLQGLGSVHVEAAEAAHSAATMAAAACWEQQNTSAVEEGLFGARDRISGTSSKRGIATEGVSRETQVDAAAAASSRGSDGTGIAVVLQAEAAVWTELDLVVEIAGRLKLRQLALPPGLLSLRPPNGGSCAEGTSSATGSHSATKAASLNDGPPTSASSPATLDSTSDQQSNLAQPAASSVANSSEGSDNSTQAAVEHCPAEYPPLRRAQRLSFAMPIILPDISPSEGRQAIVEADSIEGRLGLIQTGLRKHRKVLAALALLRGLEPT